MSVRDVPLRSGHPIDDPETLVRWLDVIGRRQNIDDQISVSTVSSADETYIFSVSASKTYKATVAQFVSAAGVGSGTVLSVNISGANGITVTGNPITVSGTIALSLGNITPTNVSTNTVTSSMVVTPAVKFPATQVASADANTLDDYEEGTWTPTDGSGAALSLTISDATYTKIGRFILVRAYITYPVTASGANAIIAGFPFTIATYGAVPLHSTAPVSIGDALAVVGTTTMNIYNTAGVNITNLQLSGAAIIFCAVYET